MGLINGHGLQITLASGSTAMSKTYTYQNLFNPNNYTIGLLSAAGSIQTSQTGCITTDFLPVTAGQLLSAGMIKTFLRNPWFICQSFKEVNRAYVFYDSSKNVISGQSDNYYSEDDTMVGITVPPGASYVRVSFGGAYVPKSPVTYPSYCFVYCETVAVTEPTFYFENNTETASAEVSGDIGKTWVLFGDSLTDSYGGHDWQSSTSPVGGIGWQDTEDRVPWTGDFWATRIAKKHGLILDNRAKSGSCMYYSRVYSTVSGVLILDAFIAELQNNTIEEPDFITIGFGANHVQDEMGTADDTASNSSHSWYAGAKYFCERLRAYCPHSEVLFIGTPKQDGWRDSSNDSNAVIQSVCESYGYRYIDFSDTDYSGIAVDMLPDSLHVSSIEANDAYFRALDRAMF